MSLLSSVWHRTIIDNAVRDLLTEAWVYSAVSDIEPSLTMLQGTYWLKHEFTVSDIEPSLTMLWETYWLKHEFTQQCLRLLGIGVHSQHVLYTSFHCSLKSKSKWKERVFRAQDTLACSLHMYILHTKCIYTNLLIKLICCIFMCSLSLVKLRLYIPRKSFLYPGMQISTRPLANATGFCMWAT